MTESAQRRVSLHYADPVDLVWTQLLHRLGLTLSRTEHAFATYDGRGEVALSTTAHLDSDDCIAQMVLHELCHALVQGRRGLQTVDWGLPCEDGAGLDEEYAAQRLQAYFADTVGMRAFFAVTTQWRPYWDALEDDPLPQTPLSSAADPTVVLARQGLENAKGWGWEAPMAKALEATAQIAEAIAPWVGEVPSLWRGAQGRHPATAIPYGRSSQHRCGDCAWAKATTTPGVLSCLQADAHVRVDDRSCRRFEPPLAEDACGSCGACCREAFDEVEVAEDDLLWQITELRDLIASSDGRHCLPRPAGRCELLVGDDDTEPFRCRAYSSRPRSCREFTKGSVNCLLARQRVGLSKAR